MKKQTKKLELNKKTISNLNSPEMSRLIGGGSCAKGYSCENGHTYNCTQNQNTCPDHKTCYGYYTCYYC